MKPSPAHDIQPELLDRLRGQETTALLDRLRSKGADKGADDDAETAALHEVLAMRQGRFPDDAAAVTPAAKPSELRPLAADSNAAVATLGADKIQLAFPRDGFIQCGRSRFKDATELTAYLADVLSLRSKAGAARLTVRRKGKYQRVDRMGSPIHTFGDPILDLITDERGWLTVGRETVDLLQRDIAAPGSRRGGIRNIDLALDPEDIKRQQLAEALGSSGTRTLLQRTGDQLAIASSNPSQLDFWKGSAHLRFRSWKTNYYIYRSIGSEIETWGGDFVRAEIQSMYADPVVGNPFICGIVKRDADSDTNDDYVDEYEYAVAAKAPSSVRSFCQANWKGQMWGGTVSKGDCQTFL
jgi:hypothetical protein